MINVVEEEVKELTKVGNAYYREFSKGTKALKKADELLEEFRTLTENSSREAVLRYYKLEEEQNEKPC